MAQEHSLYDRVQQEQVFPVDRINDIISFYKNLEDRNHAIDKHECYGVFWTLRQSLSGDFRKRAPHFVESLDIFMMEIENTEKISCAWLTEMTRLYFWQE